MTTRLRFTLLLGVLLAGFFVSAFTLRQMVATERTRNLGADRESRAKLLNFWIETSSRDLPRIAADWAESEVFAKALGEIAGGAASGNIQSAMIHANITALWVVRADGTLAAQVSAEPRADASALPLEPYDLRRLLAETPSPRFFSHDKTGLQEFCSRRLQEGKNRDWLLVSRIWTPAHLQTLAALTEGKVEIRLPESLSLEEKSESRTVLMRPLLDWQGKAIRVLRVEYDNSEIETLFHSNWSQAIYYTVFGLIVLIAMTLALQSWVLEPLSLIRTSLASEDGSQLKGLAEKGSEFGHVAKLVMSAFNQQATLKAEIIERKRLQESLSRSEAALKKSIEDRARLGRDLHDGVIQSLYAAGMGLAGVRAQLRPDQSDAAGQLELTRGTLNETIRDVRNFIVGLEPEATRDQKFSHAVESLVKSMRGLGRFDTSAIIDNEVANKLSLTQRAHALQITKEAISNALRHGKADHIRITLQSNSNGVLLEISDNGCGFDPTSKEVKGKGLANFEQRARELGAELRVVSTVGQGTQIEITFTLT